MDNPIKIMGRVGYAARAVVYGLVGIFAILLMFREGGALTDTKGILQRLMDFPFGKTILAGIAAGLFFFSIWRFMQALRDYEDKGSNAKGIAVRIGYVFSAIAYAFLGYNAINLILHLSETSNQSGEKKIAQTLMGQHFGPFLLGLAALIIAGLGFFQIYIALKEKFKKGLELPHSTGWLATICKIGITARGIVFCLVGWLFLRASLHANSNEADGLKGVWKLLASHNYGFILVVGMAIGLMAFSVYGFTESAYRRSISH